MLSRSADHVAAFVLRPRAVDRTDGRRARCCSPPTRSRDAGFDPSDAGDLWDLVNRQDWAICESVQRGMSSRAYTHGWFAPMEDDSLDIRRWLLPAARQDAADEPSTSTTSSSGSARSAAPPPGAGPARPPRARARAVRARPRAAAPATTPAGSCGTATTRPAYVAADPGGVRRLGAARARRPASSWSPWSAGSTCSRPSAAIAPIDYTTSLRRGRHRLRAARRRRDRRSAGRSSRCPTGTVGAATRRDAAIVPAGRGTAADAGARRAGTAPTLRERTPGDRGARPRRDGVEVDAARTSIACRGLVVVRRRLDQRGARPASACEVPLEVTLEQVTYFAPERPDAVRAGPAAAVDLDGRPVVLRLPLLRRADRQGGPGLRRAGRRPRRTAPSEPDPAMRDAARRRTWRRMLPGQRRAGALAALPVHADPRPRLRARAGARPRVGRGRARRRARLQVRADVRPAARRPGRRRAYDDRRLGRSGSTGPALTDPDYQAHWLV